MHVTAFTLTVDPKIACCFESIRFSALLSRSQVFVFSDQFELLCYGSMYISNMPSKTTSSVIII